MFDDDRLDWPPDTLGYQAAMLNLAMLRLEAIFRVEQRRCAAWVDKVLA